MLRLNFPTFLKKKDYELDNGYYPTIHCLEEVDKFTFVFKSRERWEYYAVITLEDIQAFSEYLGMPIEEVVAHFRINYCTNTMPFEKDMVTEIIAVEDQDKMIVTKPNVNKDLIIDAGEDMIEEAEDYGQFLNKLFDNMEKKVLIAVDKIGLNKSYLTKGFGDFVRDLFNVVNTSVFAKHIKRFIKADLISGLVSAESELNVDIGFTNSYQQKLNVLSQEQLNGYTINGKKWFGIKGVSKEIQSKIIMTVQSGVAEHKTITEIKEAIKEDFAGFSDHRANMISRTETNRILNSSKLLGYKESGLPGGKVWKAAQPRGCKNCSAICDRLDAKYGDNPIPLDADFIDDKSGRAFQHPPALPNCKSCIAFRPS